MEKKQIWTVAGIALVVLIVGFVYTNMTGEAVEEGVARVYHIQGGDVIAGGEAYTFEAEISDDLKTVNLELYKLDEFLGDAKGVKKGDVVKFYYRGRELYVQVLNIKETWDRKAYAILRVSEVS